MGEKVLQVEEGRKRRYEVFIYFSICILARAFRKGVVYSLQTMHAFSFYLLTVLVSRYQCPSIGNVLKAFGFILE